MAKKVSNDIQICELGNATTTMLKNNHLSVLTNDHKLDMTLKVKGALTPNNKVRAAG